MNRRGFDMGVSVYEKKKDLDNSLFFGDKLRDTTMWYFLFPIF